MRSCLGLFLAVLITSPGRDKSSILETMYPSAAILDYSVGPDYITDLYKVLNYSYLAFSNASIEFN